MDDTPLGSVDQERGLASPESIFVAIGALVLISLLGLPVLAYIPKSEEFFTADCDIDPDATQALAGNSPTTANVTKTQMTNTSRLVNAPLQQQTLSCKSIVFFVINYIIWVTLATGYNACNKAYMRETRNAEALLFVQGWVGVGVMLSMNLLAQCQRKHSSSYASSAPSWQGKCGLRDVVGLGWNVWVAGFFHSANALLTSWSVLVGGVALTQALKAFEPVVAAALSRCLLGSRLTPCRLAAIVVIVVGLCILMLPRHREGSTTTSIDVTLDKTMTVELSSGAPLSVPASMTALACCAVALRNVFLKRNPPSSPPPPLGLLGCSIVGAGFASILLFLQVFSEYFSSPELLLRWSGINTALCFVGYNFASFNLLSELSPTGHAVGNSSKRVILFASGLFFMGERGSMSIRQLIGASIAFAGLAAYSLVAKSRQPVEIVEMVATNGKE